MSDLFNENPINIEDLEQVKVSKKELKQFGLEKGDLFFCRSSLVMKGIGQSNIVTIWVNGTLMNNTTGSGTVGTIYSTTDPNTIIGLDRGVPDPEKVPQKSFPRKWVALKFTGFSSVSRNKKFK